MRATLSSYYRNLQFDQSKTAKALFDVTKQISSGQKIQYAHENVGTFIDTVRLDNEVTTLTQVKEISSKALQFSTNTDSTMSSITSIIDAMKMRLVSASDGTKSPDSLHAIASELRGLESNLKQLANTSINGKYLFSGSEIQTKPIDDNGVYQGNAEDMTAFIGSGVEQAYNISGADLFFGDENQTRRSITSNVRTADKAQLYPHVMGDSVTALDSKEVYINSSNTIRDLVGGIHSQPDLDANIESYSTTHFYLRGTDHFGESFKQRIEMDGSESVASLLDKIGEAYGNTASSDLVTVSLNANGQIEILDKLPGSSKLDFHIVGATDFDPAGADDANVVNLNDLDGGTTDFDTVINGTSANKLLITEFMKSGLEVSNTANNLDAIRYDEFNFSQNGVNLTSNMPQIVKEDNAYATDITKLVDVVSGSTAVGNVLDLKGTTINGSAYDIQVNLSTPGSYVTGTVAGVAVDFDIFNTATPRVAVHPDDMTYKQLGDVVNMIVTNNLPANGNALGNDVQEAIDYDNALLSSKYFGEVTLDHKGRMTFKETNTSATSTAAKISLNDRDTEDFFGAVKGTGAAFSFQNNNALSISDPKTDFFAQINEAISSVELGRTRADGGEKDPRNLGMQNALSSLDDLSDHLFRQHSVAGVHSQTLQTTADRTDILIVTTQTLRSDTIDVDIASASLEMKQLELNYQAMLSTVSRISQLSLVNYL